MSEEVNIPWLDEPVSLAEGVEAVAYANQHDEELTQEVTDRVDDLEERLRMIARGSEISCPSCEQTEQVYKAGVGAAKLANEGNLSDENADALNQESHVCLDCQESFTPWSA